MGGLGGNSRLDVSRVVLLRRGLVVSRILGNLRLDLLLPRCHTSFSWPSATVGVRRLNQNKCHRPFETTNAKPQITITDFCTLVNRRTHRVLRPDLHIKIFSECAFLVARNSARSIHPDRVLISKVSPSSIKSARVIRAQSLPWIPVARVVGAESPGVRHRMVETEEQLVAMKPLSASQPQSIQQRFLGFSLARGSPFQKPTKKRNVARNTRLTRNAGNSCYVLHLLQERLPRQRGREFQAPRFMRALVLVVPRLEVAAGGRVVPHQSPAR